MQFKQLFLNVSSFPAFFFFMSRVTHFRKQDTCSPHTHPLTPKIQLPACKLDTNIFRLLQDFQLLLMTGHRPARHLPSSQKSLFSLSLTKSKGSPGTFSFFRPSSSIHHSDGTWMVLELTLSHRVSISGGTPGFQHQTFILALITTVRN